MIVAYKYLRFEDGILLIFEKEVPLDEADVSLGFARIDGTNYLKIRERHFVPLDVEIFEWLKQTKRIYIAVSEIFSTRVEMQGVIELDDISIGRLLAYVDMN